MSNFTFWSWGQAIQAADIQPTTKLILFNLAVHMNGIGEGCYPSTKKQAADTGLSERCVCTHLELACQAGFLKKQAHGYSGQGWKRNEYIACFPESKKGTEPDDKLEQKALNLTTEGTERSDKKALNVVQSNLPENKPENKPVKRKKKKLDKMTLAEWEEINGRLDLCHLVEWGRKNQLCPNKTSKAIDYFRDAVVAKGYLYADFPAAFRNWNKDNLESLKITTTKKEERYL